MWTKTCVLLIVVGGTIGLALHDASLGTVLRAQESVCTASLKPDLTSLKSNDAIRLAWLNIMDVERFHEERKNIDTGGSVLVYGYPLSGYGNYGEMSQARDREFQLRQFNYSREQSIDFLQSKVSGAAYDTFIKCLEIESRKQPGLHIWPKRVADDSVDLAILWNVPGRNITLTTTSVQVAGTAIPKTFLPRNLLSSAQFEQRFVRKQNQDFYVAINFEGYSDSVHVSKPIVLSAAAPPKICRPPSSESDLGYPETRFIFDIDNDGCEDFCRLVGGGTNHSVLCTFGHRDGAQIRPKAASTIGDGGYATTRHWIDYNTDGRMDFCRVVGSGPYEMHCQPLQPNGTLGPKETIWDAGRDFGYTSRWVDMNGDGIRDWCRQVGSTPSIERCLVNDRKKLGAEIAGQ
jgi:hypothetical protein